MKDYCKYQQSLLALELPFAQLRIPAPHLFDTPLAWLTLNMGWRKTYYGLKIQTEYLRARGQELLALNLLIKSLEKNTFWFNHTVKWWHLMATAILIAQSLELYSQEKMCLPLQRLMKLMVLGPQPWSGREVAFCFATMSFWSFLSGKNNKAIEQVNIAIQAEKTWGYPEYLLGWYGLLLEGLDPVPHFLRAIKCNGRYWQLLQHDPLIAQHPDVLQKVKQANEKTEKLL